MMVVARFLGKRPAALNMVVISLCTLGAGILLDRFYLKVEVSATATMGTAKELLSGDLKVFLWFYCFFLCYTKFSSGKRDAVIQIATKIKG
ncbi:MAG: hypothetical protein WB014_03165 [Methanosarcina sp.]